MIIWQSSGIKMKRARRRRPKNRVLGKDLGFFEPIFGPIFLSLKEMVGGGGSIPKTSCLSLCFNFLKFLKPYGVTDPESFSQWIAEI